MKALGIIADDLTGSSDSGVQLARQGFDTYVVFDPQNLKVDDIPDVIVMDTDSRSISGEQAYLKVKLASETLKGLEIDQVFKKLDSTLRGNIGSEIDAVMDVYSFDFAVIAPAFPRIGRTTKNGIHYLNGTPVHETEIAKDPKTPVNESEITKLLSQQSARKSRLVPLDLLHKGKHALLEDLTSYHRDGIQFLVFDAMEDQDLQNIVEWLSDSPYTILWVGSAGLADYMPALLGEPQQNKDSFTVPQPAKPVLLVAGSLSKVTKGQVDYFNKQQNVAAVEFDPVSVMNASTWEEQKEKCRIAIKEAYHQGLDISFHVGTSEEQLAKTRDPVIQRKFKHEISLRIADSLGEIASDVIGEYAIQGVILTGGDTAKAVCRHLGVSGLQLLEEVESGIPLSKLLGPNEVLAVTKAGAFGKEPSLVHALKTLKGDKSTL